MKDVNHAMSVLRQRAGIADLAFNADGQAELVIERAVSVYVTRVSDAVLEMSARIAALDGRLEREVMERLLVANSLGDGTGHSRLAIDPRTRGALLCERVDVTALEAAPFEARFVAFVRHAAYWQAEGARDVLAGEPADVPPATESWSANFIRI